jgi:hypothetical protein
MYKLSQLFGSFVLGACGMFLALSFIHASIPVLASQQPPQEQKLPPSTIAMPAAIPVVPPLQYEGHGSTIGGAAQQLDGFSCDGCTVTTGALIYGGGAYSFSNTKLPRNVPLILTGAALNTYKLLRLTGVIPNPTPPSPAIQPEGPVMRADLVIKAQPMITFVSVEGTK